MGRSPRYQRIPSYAQFYGHGAHGGASNVASSLVGACRSRAARASSSGLLLLAACLASSLLTYGVTSWMQHRATADAAAAVTADGAHDAGGAAGGSASVRVSAAHHGLGGFSVDAASSLPWWQADMPQGTLRMAVPGASAGKAGALRPSQAALRLAAASRLLEGAAARTADVQQLGAAAQAPADETSSAGRPKETHVHQPKEQKQLPKQQQHHHQQQQLQQQQHNQKKKQKEPLQQQGQLLPQQVGQQQKQRASALRAQQDKPGGDLSGTAKVGRAAPGASAGTRAPAGLKVVQQGKQVEQHGSKPRMQAPSTVLPSKASPTGPKARQQRTDASADQQQPRAKPAAPAGPGRPATAAEGAGRPAPGGAAAAAAAAVRARAAVVNHAPYHLEVVAAWLALLRRAGADVVLHQAGQPGPNGTTVLGASRLLETAGFHTLVDPSSYELAPAGSPPGRADFVVFVSPEYFLQETEAFLRAARPEASVMIAHNGNNPAVKRLLQFAPRAHVVALAPHVAAAARQSLGIDADWAMPAVPFTPKPLCTMAALDATSCLHGFSIQGNFEPFRRNYTHVWDMLRARVAAGQLPPRYPLPPLHLHLVGRGRVEQLHLPAELAGMVTLHCGMPYQDYYERIHRTRALLLVLGSSSYTASKASSSIVSSLAAGTPVVADAAVLKAYSFLTRDAVFFMEKGEDEADVMLRILAMSPAEVFRTHTRVAELAEGLTQRALGLLVSKWMPWPVSVSAISGRAWPAPTRARAGM